MFAIVSLLATETEQSRLPNSPAVIHRGVPGARAQRALQQNPADHSRRTEDAAFSLFLLCGRLGAERLRGGMRLATRACVLFLFSLSVSRR